MLNNNIISIIYIIYNILQVLLLKNQFPQNIYRVNRGVKNGIIKSKIIYKIFVTKYYLF
jgi:hypothetical protein